MVSQTQITLIQIDNYGPWTETLGSDREHKLQTLQSDLYTKLQERFSRLNGLVFYSRYDEMLAVSNLISLEEHREIQEDICSDYPVTISMGIGCGSTPFEAQRNAASMLRKLGGAQSPSRRKVIGCDKTVSTEEALAQIAHMDIDNSTDLLTDVKTPYETMLTVDGLFSILSKSLVSKGALLFFMGGDNFMAVSSDLDTAFLRELFKEVEVEHGLQLKCGIGTAKTARRAAKWAAESLTKIRGGSRTRIQCLTET